MEIGANTPLIISVGSLIGIIAFAISTTQKVTKFKEHTETTIKNHDERIREIESLEIKTILTEIQTNLKWIMKKMEEK